ncbi:hypothetical protein [Butyrivibrio sp. VCD2006]|uniref:hypothetical protein n=1 Tax=Butyrivibrio sp. VCD2006 TaxID=1280664 RepID=UPI0004063243|nr:hypothetical protein [Butyrivibrio sp. VCD2006]
MADENIDDLKIADLDAADLIPSEGSDSAEELQVDNSEISESSGAAEMEAIDPGVFDESLGSEEIPPEQNENPEQGLSEPELQIMEPEASGESITEPVMKTPVNPEPVPEPQVKKTAPKQQGNAGKQKPPSDEAKSGSEEEKKEPENLVVEGYEFLSPEDAKKAALDKQKIDILGRKVHSTKVADLEAVYEKAISNKIFSTPVGWYYLARLRDRLYEAGVKEEDLIPIPINLKITKVDLKDEYHPKQYIMPPPPKKKKDVKAVFVVLVAMNIILVALVVALFVIAINSETDNIINYKQNVTNRFAEWEDSLKTREKAVRIKERDLRIQDDTPYLEDMGLSEDDLLNLPQESEENIESE